MPDIPEQSQSFKEEAIYLGVLTSRRVKPLSRLEYPVQEDVLDAFKGLGLTIAPVTRYAQNGTQVTHLILSRDRRLIRQYQIQFDGSVILGELPFVVRVEAKFFGYPACCAEAYINDPYAPNGLCDEVIALLFHYACPGCMQTPRLIPLYNSALAETWQILKRLS